MKKFTLSKWMLSLLLATSALTGSHAFAQPDLQNPPKGENPPMAANWQQMWQNMSPEQRKQTMQAMVEQIVRLAIEQLGIKDAETQNLIVKTMNDQDAIYEPVREQHLKVAQALIKNEPDDKVMAALLQGLRDASEKASIARDATIKTLDDRIAFTQQPRLEALLTMLGVVGNETEHVGGVVSSLGVAMGSLAIAGELPPMMMPPGIFPPVAPPAR